MLVKEREAMKEFVKVSIDEMKMEIMKSISNELLVTVQKYADNHEKVFQIEKEQAKIQSDILELRSFLIKYSFVYSFFITFFFLLKSFFLALFILLSPSFSFILELNPKQNYKMLILLR